jgi:hypothetical protein
MLLTGIVGNLDENKKTDVAFLIQNDSQNMGRLAATLE